MGCFHYTRGTETRTMLALSTAPWFRSTSLIDFPKKLVVLRVQSHIRKPFKPTLLLKVLVPLWRFLLHQLSWFNGLRGLNEICVTIWFKSALGEERVMLSCNRMRLTMKEYLAQYRSERPLNWFWNWTIYDMKGRICPSSSVFCNKIKLVKLRLWKTQDHTSP